MATEIEYIGMVKSARNLSIGYEVKAKVSKGEAKSILLTQPLMIMPLSSRDMMYEFHYDYMESLAILIAIFRQMMTLSLVRRSMC